MSDEVSGVSDVSAIVNAERKWSKIVTKVTKEGKESQKHPKVATLHFLQKHPISSVAHNVTPTTMMANAHNHKPSNRKSRLLVT